MNGGRRYPTKPGAILLRLIFQDDIRLRPKPFPEGDSHHPMRNQVEWYLSAYAVALRS
jgi:hypothetical protein